MPKRTAVPNVHGTTCTLLITRPTGDSYVALYDVADRPEVERWTWSLDKALYVYRKVQAGSGAPQRTVYLARQLLGLSHRDGLYADHVNGNPLDNRRENLRVTSNARNCANQPVQNDRGTSRYRGVQWKADRGRRRGQVRMNYRSHHVGYFSTEEEAFAAVSEFRRLHGLPDGHG